MHSLLKVAAERPNSALRVQWDTSSTSQQFMEKVRVSFPRQFERLLDISGMIMKCDKLAKEIRQRQDIHIPV
eukprot:12374888-Alexandrium_andersonii.AAC.1